MIDLAFVTNIMKGNEKLAGRFLFMFKTQTPQQISELKTHVDNHDWEELSKTADSLKTQFNYLQLHTLSDQMEEILLLSEEFQSERINKIITHVEAEFWDLFDEEPSV